MGQTVRFFFNHDFYCYSTCYQNILVCDVKYTLDQDNFSRLKIQKKERKMRIHFLIYRQKSLITFGA